MGSLARGVYIVGAKRTPFGAFGGKLGNKTPTDLQEVASRAALTAANVNPESVDSVVVGIVNVAAAPDSAYISRHVGLRCGVPISSPALTLNRLCGSGFQSVVTGAQEIMLDESQIVLTGGVESMSLFPFAARDVRFGVKLGSDIKLEDTLWNSLTDSHCKMPMGITAENLAVKYKVTREEVDAFAIRSQTNWKKAQDSGYFKAEIAPVMLEVKRQQISFEVDEHPKPETTLEKLKKLPPVFKKEGVVTAGTASGICDGAGSIVLASEAAVKTHNLKPLARLVGYAVAGVDPSIMGIGPAPAIRKLLKLSNMQLKDVDLVEINEAFAAQVLSCQRELDLNPEILNVNGGAIALGHPLAASGARITAHLTHELIRRKAKYAIGSACIGGGQGIALLLESIH